MEALIPPPTSLAPRAVPVGHAFAWYEEAMRLFKHAPFRWCALGLITLATEIGLQLVPGFGVAAARVIVPVVECGMLLGAAALDRGARLDIGYAFAAFRAPAGALVAIVGSALLVFAAEALAGYALAGVNLLADNAADAEMTPIELFGVFAIGALASLPVTFVPLAALLAHASCGRAFASSLRGFAYNVAPLLLFGALALLLIAFGLLTFGAGLIAVYPLLAAASYAAWKDIYATTAGSV